MFVRSKYIFNLALLFKEATSSVRAISRIMFIFVIRMNPVNYNLSPLKGKSTDLFSCPILLSPVYFESRRVPGIKNSSKRAAAP